MAASALIVSSTVAIAPASADDWVPYGTNGNWTGADIDAGGFQNSDQAVEKAKLVTAYAAVVRGESDAVRLRALADAYGRKFGAAALSSDMSASAERFAASASTTAATSKILGLSQYGQQKSYWCGPATAYMIMKYLGITTSRYAGYEWGLSQNSFASVPYLKTEQNGATRFSLNVMAPALNHWRENRAAGFYVQYTPGAVPAASFGDLMIYSAGIGMPNTPATVEYANEAHYNGHRADVTVGHWLVGYGYASSGAVGYFADPATTVWSGVQPKFTYTTSNYWNIFIARHGNGIVY